jgi:hypothetical protein
VLACRVLEPGQWCRRCGCEGLVRDTVIRQLACEPPGWRPTTLAVTIRRYRCGDEPLTGWATSDNSALRLVAAERLPDTVDGQLNSLLCRLTFDPDRYVAVAAVRSIADARTTAAVEHLKGVVSAQLEEWTCQRCGSSDHDTTDRCAEFHIVLPDPVKTAREKIAEITSRS